MTCNEFYPFYQQYQEDNMAKNTKVSRCSCIRCHFLPFYGMGDLQDITPADINSVYDKMEEKLLAQNTLYGCREALINFFHLAEGCGHIEPGSNPARRARQIRPNLHRY